MLSHSEILSKIQDYFAPTGIKIVLSDPANDVGSAWIRSYASGINPDYLVRFLDRSTIAITEKTALGFLIHEGLHLAAARPGWDHLMDGDTFNWVDKKNITSAALGWEDVSYVYYGFYIINELNIIKDIKVLDSRFPCVEHSQPIGLFNGSDKFLLGKEKFFENFIHMGMMTSDYRLVSKFNLDKALENIDKISGQSLDENNVHDFLGMVPMIGSPVWLRDNPSVGLDKAVA